MTDEAIPDASELAETGWLTRRIEQNGDLSWWWTPATEHAFDVNGVLQAADGRQN